MPDHVQLVLKTGPKLDVSALMKNLKGVPSTLVNDMTHHVVNFRWQEGYYAKTITPSQFPRILKYELRQKDHHQCGATHSAFQETGEEL